MKATRVLAFALLLALPALPYLAETRATGHYRMGEQHFDIAAGLALRLWQDAERESWGVVLGEGSFDPSVAVRAIGLLGHCNLCAAARP